MKQQDLFDFRTYVRVQYTSTKCDPRTGEPYRWNAIVDSARADDEAREASRRWPDVTAEVVRNAPR